MNKIKVFIIGLITIFCTSFIVIFIFSNKEKDNKPQGNSRKEIIVGLDDAFPPMGFRDEKGEIVGFDIDLAKEAAKRFGIEVTFKPVVWDTVILSLTNKEIDIIWNGMTITDERKEKILFSIPYLKGEDIFIVKKNSGMESIEDLSGKSIGVQAGSSQEEALKDSKIVNTIEIKSYETLPDMILDLDNGRISAVLCDNFAGLYYIEKTLQKTNDFESIESGFEPTYTGVGIRKEDEDLKNDIDRVLEEMIADGTASSISIKWFGKDLVVK